MKFYIHLTHQNNNTIDILFVPFFLYIGFNICVLFPGVVATDENMKRHVIRQAGGNENEKRTPTNVRIVPEEESLENAFPNAFLYSLACLYDPSNSVCEFTCIEGYKKPDFASALDFIYLNGDSVYIQCKNGTWKTGFEKYGHKLQDICLPEAVFHKCPQSIPNGNLEDHCGPTLDWLCNFECNDGYNRHPFMTGSIKGFFNDPEKLFCGEDGVWRTGYENIGLNVSGVCFGDVADENCTDDLPNSYVYHKPVQSGHSHGMKCLDGYRLQTLDSSGSNYGRATCMNGEWVVRATKYDPRINPQTVCIRNDTRRVCPRNIPNGRIPEGCTVNCRPVCNEGYHVFGELSGFSRAPDSITCEDGKWLTESQPYTGDNICVPVYGMFCSEEIPNGKLIGPEYLLKDFDRGRRHRGYYCNPGSRHHRSILYIECIAGNWVTWNERFGLNVSALCVPETEP